jgi:hypothetical protein
VEFPLQSVSFPTVHVRFLWFRDVRLMHEVRGTCEPASSPNSAALHHPKHLNETGREPELPLKPEKP